MKNDTARFTDRLAATARDIETLLDRLLSPAALSSETARPPRLIAAMRHGALDGGKRLRPFLVVETAALFDVDRAGALMAGAALELIHCYSLVHDDLPAMDNDGLRRGRPTVHKAFDDATAILAGDALLTLAFDVMARDEVHADAAVRTALVLELARASGLGGMAGGQMLDLAAEGRFEGKRTLSENEIVTLQAMKTGALIRFACNAGAILGKADAAARARIARYGSAIGQAFQIADDLLDVEGDAKTLGKAAGKDAAAGKATLVATLGIDRARGRLNELVAEASAALASFGEKSDTLRAAARFIAERTGLNRAKVAHGQQQAYVTLSMLPVRIVRLHARVADLRSAIGIAVLAGIDHNGLAPGDARADWMGCRRRRYLISDTIRDVARGRSHDIRRRAAEQDEGATSYCCCRSPAPRSPASLPSYLHLAARSRALNAARHHTCCWR